MSVWTSAVLVDATCSFWLLGHVKMELRLSYMLSQLVLSCLVKLTPQKRPQHPESDSYWAGLWDPKHQVSPGMEVGLIGHEGAEEESSGAQTLQNPKKNKRCNQIVASYPRATRTFPQAWEKLGPFPVKKSGLNSKTLQGQRPQLV